MLMKNREKNEVLEGYKLWKIKTGGKNTVYLPFYMNMILIHST